ncbi:Cof-type HAD-IIB family hydrolase [Leuconostoc inhae]|uniref:Cof-type HAD-IIB family hydrolase n=1 Tax=Leuconostoc inhae TaxID=178001 RepID=UPI001C7CDC1F|nr:Cof-type HAD-IIB family hydrolase [Leuconostoc inhae]
MRIKRILFFDLDGTLCPNQDMQVSPELIPLFQEFKNEGTLPVIASGRSFYEVEPLLEQLQVDSFILSNGCYVVSQGQVVQDYQMPTELIQSILHVAGEHQHDVGFFNQSEYAVTGMNAVTQSHMTTMHLAHTRIDPLFYQNHTTNFLNIYLNETQEQIYHDLFNKQLNIIRYAPLAIDILPRGISKSQAIEKMIINNNLSDIPTYAFGDQNNDLSMFETVDYGVAMKDAIPELKKVAAYTATTNYGVLEGLKHFNII